MLCDSQRQGEIMASSWPVALTQMKFAQADNFIDGLIDGTPPNDATQNRDGQTRVAVRLSGVGQSTEYDVIGAPQLKQTFYRVSNRLRSQSAIEHTE